MHNKRHEGRKYIALLENLRQVTTPPLRDEAIATLLLAAAVDRLTLAQETPPSVFFAVEKLEPKP